MIQIKKKNRYSVDIYKTMLKSVIIEKIKKKK